MAPAVPAVAATYLGVSTVLSFLQGFTTTSAIGGADMRMFCLLVILLQINLPYALAVVICVLNSYSGFALVAEGTSTIFYYVFGLSHPVLERIHVGQPPAYDSRIAHRSQRFNSFVHHGEEWFFQSSFKPITRLRQCVAMNRSLANVLFGGIEAAPTTEHKIEGVITKTSADDVVESLSNADNVILVCGNASISLGPCTEKSRSLGMVWPLRKPNTPYPKFARYSGPGV